MSVTTGDMQAIGTHGWWITEASSGAAPTEAVTLSSPTVTATGASFTLTLPTDANRSYVALYCIPCNTDGAAVTSSSTTTAISSGTLASVTSYYAVAVPIGTGGEYGPVDSGSVRRFTTRGTTTSYTRPTEVMPDLCLVVKYWLNDYNSYCPFGPYWFDLAEVDGSQSIGVGSEIAEIGDARFIEFCCECDDPVQLKVRGVVVKYRERTEAPYGQQQRSKAL